MVYSHLLNFLFLSSISSDNKNLKLVSFLLLANIFTLEHDLRVESQLRLLVIFDSQVRIFQRKNRLIEPVDENFKRLEAD